jgi:DNA polymerase-3 subunit gamma/tau
MDPRAGEFTGLLPEEMEQVAAQAQKFTPRRLLDLMERLQDGGAALRWNSQPRVLLEMTLAGFLLDTGPSLDDLARRLEELEKRLAALDGSGHAKGQLPEIKPGETPGKPGLAGRGRHASETTGQRKAEGVTLPGKGENPASRLRPAARQQEGVSPAVFAPLELSTVQERWPEVLAAARRESVHLQAYLRAGEPVAVTGDSLTLEVKTDFHRGMLEQPANRQKVEAVLARVFGRPLKLVITAGRPPVDGVNQEVLDKLVEYFGPDKVEIKD